jgi:hypothetical protein
MKWVVKEIFRGVVRGVDRGVVITEGCIVIDVGVYANVVTVWYGVAKGVV